MIPEAKAAFEATNSVPVSTYIKFTPQIRKGRGADILRVNAKRRRTKHQIEAEREQEKNSKIEKEQL